MGKELNLKTIMANPKDDNEEEEDKVEAAYENISKKLERLRSGKNALPDEDEDASGEKESEEELEEWKGPTPPLGEGESENEEYELRKIKLKNVDQKEADTEEEGEDEPEDEPEDDKDDSKAEEPKKDWKPAPHDPLDEEIDEKEAEEESEIEKESEDMPEKSIDPVKISDNESTHDLTVGVSSLDRTSSDSGKPTTSQSGFHRDEELDLEVPKKADSQPDTLDDLTDVTKEKTGDEDDYFIPNLKGSRQTEGNVGYNTASPRESYAQSLNPSKERFMEGNDPTNFFSQHQQDRSLKRASKFHLFILVIIGVAVIGFTVYILKGGFGEISLIQQPSPSPSPVQTPVPTPTPSPEPDRAKYKLKVLNGSGKTGLAGEVSDKLKALGYQTEKSGNATNSAFTQTIIRVKPSLESFIPQIVKDLSPDFDAAGNTSLKDSDTVDIEIILGAK